MNYLADFSGALFVDQKSLVFEFGGNEKSFAVAFLAFFSFFFLSLFLDGQKKAFFAYLIIHYLGLV